MASKQARKRKQVCTGTGVLESKHRRIRQATPDTVGGGGDVGTSHSTAHGYLMKSSDCVTPSKVTGESPHLPVHHAIPAIEEAGDALAAYEPACMMNLTPRHQRLIRPTASRSGNFQLLAAAQEEGPDQPAVVLLPLVGAAQLQAGELALAINTMPPAPLVQEYDNAVVTGAPNLAADLDMIHPILHIVNEASNFQPMGAAYEEGPVRSGMAGLPLVAAAAQLIQELPPAFDWNAMPAAPPVQDHNTVLAGALSLMAAVHQDMIHQPILLPQVPGALDPVAVASQFKEWKDVNLREDTLKRESTQEIHELLLEEDL